MAGLDARGLCESARHVLSEDVQERVAEAWSRGRSLILNAHKP